MAAPFVNPNCGRQHHHHNHQQQQQQQGVFRTLEKILWKFGEKIDTSRASSELGFVIETVRTTGNLDSNVMDVYEGHGVDDIREAKMSQFVAAMIVDCLRHSNEKRQFGKLLIPEGLSQRVADDVMCMSLDEPCGIRGCVVDVILEDGEVCQRLGKVTVDPNTVTTFEITLVLAKESPRWFISKLQMYLKNYERPTFVKSSYKMVKRKLYRRESLAYAHEGLQ